MAERMRLKDKKKAKIQGNKPRLKTQMTERSFPAVLMLQEANSHNRRRERRSHSGPSNETTDQPFRDVSAIANPTTSRTSAADTACLHQNYASRMQIWRSSMLTPMSSSASDYEHISGSIDATDRASLVSVAQDSSTASFSVENDAMSNEDDSFLADSAKLKGVFWPGMDIFDSATPEMRRKRNQKKDISVIEQLESNSLGVEPTEVIFAPDGTQWRCRTISGMPYDDSNPFQDLSPPNQQLHISERVPLAEIDVNSSKARGKNSMAGHRRHRSSANVDENNNLNIGSQNVTLNTCANEQQTAPREPMRKRKRTFDVFKDEINFSNPAELSYLTAEFVNPGLVSSSITRNHDERIVWSAGSNVNIDYPGLSKEYLSRRNPRRSCQMYQQEGGRYFPGLLDRQNRSDSSAFTPSYSSRFPQQTVRPPRCSTTGTDLHTYQCYDQAFPHLQAGQQQEQHRSHQNRLFSPFSNSQNEFFLRSLQGPPHRTSETVAKLGSVLQDFPYYLSQMPYLTDTVATSADASNTAVVDVGRNGNYHTPDDSNFYSQSGFPEECHQGGYNACDLPIEEQLRLYTTDGINVNDDRSLEGPLQYSGYYDYYRSCDHNVDKELAEAEDDQKTISAPPSER